MYLIIGGTGRAGRLAARMLIDAGKPVRLLVRDPEKARAMGLSEAELVRGDVTRAETLSPAFEGVTGVFSALNTLHPGAVHLREAVEYEGNRHLIAAARQANARFVYLSVFEADQVTFPHFAVKARVEQLARQAGVPFTFLRPVTWTETLLMGMQNGRGQIIGRQTNRQQFVSVL
ncbi:MAG: SDR family oxidoreductase, partial [Anaerolineae bacterium]